MRNKLETNLSTSSISRQHVIQLLLPLVYEVVDLDEDCIRSDCGWEIIFAHEDMGDEALAELVLALGMAHEGLVPVEAGGDEPVGDIIHDVLTLGLLAAVEDQEALQVGGDRAEAGKLGLIR